MALIHADELSLGYETGAVVEQLNFDVQSGDYLCVVGENGSGKTTLMKTLLGLIPPLSGKIEMGEGLRQNEIGYLPQQTTVQRDFPASVREVVFSGFEGHRGLFPFYSAEEKQTAGEIMERMGVSTLAGSSYRDLSGGQQQRVLLARALIAARKVLILDEPVTGLDPHASQQMYELIRSLNEEGVTIIMITHDVAKACEEASHILYFGRRAFFGTAEEFAESPAGRAYLHMAEADSMREESVGGAQRIRPHSGNGGAE